MLLQGIPILSAQEIKEWDSYTLMNESIDSHELMERGALQCTNWILEHFPVPQHCFVFCGPGNNGGDGLAITRQLLLNGYQVTCIIVESNHKTSRDFDINLERLKNNKKQPVFWETFCNSNIQIPNKAIAIDAIFGNGLNKAPQGNFLDAIDFINTNFNTIISIDLPSGLFSDLPQQPNQHTITASYTLTFQSLKLSLLAPENANYYGKVEILNIQLSEDFLSKIQSPYPIYLQKTSIQSLIKTLPTFAHKGSLGHAILIGGSLGKLGAIQLSTKAALHSGAGLTSILIPGIGYSILQSSIPEAMVITPDSEVKTTWFNEQFISKIGNIPSNATAIGIGPGLGTHPQTRAGFLTFLATVKSPIVLDADALNIIALEKAIHLIPKNAILTPHPKEFERLFGKSANSFERWEKLQKRAKQYKCVIILKGHHTAIATAEGELFFNSTGNPGMATGGSGDVLTGIITALLAQGYNPTNAAVLGVYLHGLAADIAVAKKYSEESLIASSIIEFLGDAFKSLSNKN